MSRYKEFVEHVDSMMKLNINFLNEYVETIEKKHLILDAMEADIKNRNKTKTLTYTVGEVAIISGETTVEATEPKKRGRTKQRTIASRSSSLKENTGDPYPQRSQIAGRALGENNNRAPNGTLQNVVVKLEKMSDVFFQSHPDIANVPIKQEKTDMPPPAIRPMRQNRKRKGTQNTASTSDSESLHIKEELMDIESKKRKPSATPVNSKKPSTISRDSDIQITPEPVDTVNLVETDEEEVEKPRGRGRPKTKRRVQKSEIEEPQTIRVTRTKAKTAVKQKTPEAERTITISNQNHTDNSSTEEEDKVKKNSKKTNNKKKTADTSVYEDAVSDTDSSPNKDIINSVIAPTKPIMNETVVLSKHSAEVEKPKKPVLMNETVVVNKLPNGASNVLDELMTDDEDIIESPVRPPQKQKKIKQVFSPYENSPVKTRVAAFEKLGAEANIDLPLRMTRTKTKAKEQENADTESEDTTDQIPPPAKRAIPKLKNTPLAEHRAKLKLSKTASVSAVKAAQAEFRERELRRRQKEEALSKKEALVEAENEERRRKLEEKQLKAQTQREALEKERKQRKLEAAERLKQEKIKQAKAENEERLLRQREEAANKKRLAMKKAAEEKSKKAQTKKDDLNQTTQVLSKVPLYLRYETPLLPTEDCYDSDDSHSSKPFTVAPWQKKENLLAVLRCMRYSESHKRLFFNNGAETVDLKEIFPSIEPHKLKRTSSAIWNRSGMSVLQAMPEQNEEEEED